MKTIWRYILTCVAVIGTMFGLYTIDKHSWNKKFKKHHPHLKHHEWNKNITKPPNALVNLPANVDKFFENRFVNNPPEFNTIQFNDQALPIHFETNMWIKNLFQPHNIDYSVYKQRPHFPRYPYHLDI